jgi:hypothetical protein
MRRARLLVTGIGALAVAACPYPTSPRQVGVGGGGGGRVLVFVVQPATAHAGQFIVPAVQVAVEDTLGFIDTTATGGVTVALGTNPPGSAVLSGSKTISFVSGVSTFSDLTVNLVGTGYTLTATSSGFTTVTSGSFDIIP